MSESTLCPTLQAAKRNVENSKRTISEFKLVRIIGTGTFGKVYVA
jgi:hypothetical protein